MKNKIARYLSGCVLAAALIPSATAFEMYATVSGSKTIAESRDGDTLYAEGNASWTYDSADLSWIAVNGGGWTGSMNVLRWDDYFGSYSPECGNWGYSAEQTSAYTTYALWTGNIRTGYVQGEFASEHFGTDWSAPDFYFS